MDLIQYASLCLISHLKRTQREKSLQKIHESDLRESSSVLHRSQRNPSQISTLRPTSARNNSFTEAIFASNCTVCKLTAYTMVHLLWPWYICLRLSCSLSQEENHSWFLRCLAFSHFCHSYYFMKSDSWYSVSFQFPFQQSPTVPSSHVNRVLVHITMRQKYISSKKQS